jgi:hypothetical protein
MPFGRWQSVPVDIVARLDPSYLRWAICTRVVRSDPVLYTVVRDRVMQGLLAELKAELDLSDHLAAEVALLAIWRALPASR